MCEVSREARGCLTQSVREGGGLGKLRGRGPTPTIHRATKSRLRFETRQSSSALWEPFEMTSSIGSCPVLFGVRCRKISTLVQVSVQGVDKARGRNASNDPISTSYIPIIRGKFIKFLSVIIFEVSFHYIISGFAWERSGSRF